MLLLGTYKIQKNKKKKKKLITALLLNFTSIVKAKAG